MWIPNRRMWSAEIKKHGVQNFAKSQRNDAVWWIGHLIIFCRPSIQDIKLPYTMQDSGLHTNSSLKLQLQSVQHVSYLAELLQVHACICKSLTLSSTPQPFIWFSCFSYLGSQNMEFLTASHSAVSNTLFIQMSFKDPLLSVSVPCPLALIYSNF